MKFYSSPNAEELNVARETLFCINKSHQFLQQEKKQKFLNKLTFEYSLSKINRQKIYGRLISPAAEMYPALICDGNKYAAQQYSSPKIRQNRRSYILYKQQPLPQHQESIKRYSNILSKKKMQGGGLDSFWMFKKQAVAETKKKGRKEIDFIRKQSDVNPSQFVNKSEQAYINILAWAKLPTDIQNSMISRTSIKNYLSSFFGENFANWFLNFYQVRNYINFKQYEHLQERFKHLSPRQSLLLSFFLYDQNGDGFICPRDTFSVFEKQLNQIIEDDAIKIGKFVKTHIGKEQGKDDTYKIQQLVIRDDWLTIKDYEMYFKKIDEPFLKATNKKDTVFSKTFAVLEHREKIRSTRRQINQKQSMYNELYGIIAKQHRNQAYIEQYEYKLNIAFLAEIFESQKTKLLCFFLSHLFGIDS